MLGWIVRVSEAHLRVPEVVSWGQQGLTPPGSRRAGWEEARPGSRTSGGEGRRGEVWDGFLHPSSAAPTKGRGQTRGLRRGGGAASERGGA